jgi:nucleoside-diphosphate-sugar epimerase
MRRALVTGAGGFIGRHLVARLLREGVSVRGVLHRPLLPNDWPFDADVVVGDVRDVSAMKTAAMGCDTVFHLAGCSGESSGSVVRPSVLMDVNVEGTRCLAQAAVAAGVRRFVYFSSVKAMGEETRGCDDESAEARPVTDYGRSKLAAENVVFGEKFASVLHVACLRLPLVYGPGSRGSLFRMIAAIDRGWFPPIPEVGNRRSMVHVFDAVSAALLAAVCPRANGGCYIVTDQRDCSTRQLYEACCAALGKSVPTWHVPLRMFRGFAVTGDAMGRLLGRRLTFDSETLRKLLGSASYSSRRISRDLGYAPSTSIYESIPSLISWYREAQGWG